MKTTFTPEAEKKGEYGQKTDIYITIGMDMSVIDSSISHKKASREKALKDAEKLARKLEKLDGGFVINESAKNYTLGKNFKSRGGFSAGAFSGAGGLNFLQELYRKVGKGTEARQVFNGIKNMGKGTIGEGNTALMQLLKDSLSADVAYALFDDYDAIGVVKSTGAQQLHILDLNGVQIPLSFYLYLCAQALKRAADNLEENAEDLVKVSISPADAIYDDIEFSDYTKQMWDEQVEYSDANSIIDVHFFKNFEDIVKEYLSF